MMEANVQSKGKSSHANFEFLMGGGEMSERICSIDWSKSPLGSVADWPQSLLTTLSIVLNSKFPMLLYWGKELCCFYNDAFRPSLGFDGKHPNSLGKSAREFWPELWSVIKPLTDDVLSTGQAIWSEDQLVRIYRNGRMEDTYWTFSYSGVKDESGKPAGILVTCTETTAQVVAQNRIAEREEQLHFAIEATRLGTWDYNPTTNKFSGNKRLKDWFGLKHDEEEIALDVAIDAVKETDRSRVKHAIETALQFSSGGRYDISYSIIHPVTKKERFVHAVGRAWFKNQKVAYQFSGTLQDVTERKLYELEHQKQIALIENSIDFISIADLEGNALFVNEAGRKLVGLSPEDVRTTKIIDYFPEDEKGYIQYHVLPLVMKNGSWTGEVRYQHFKTDEIIHVTWNIFVMRDRVTGEVINLGCVSQNLTDRKKVELIAKESEERFLMLADQSPMMVFIIEPNPEASISYWNKTWLDYTGQTLDQALGRAWDGIVHPDDVPDVLDIYAPAFANRVPYTIPGIRLKRYDGEYRWYLFRGNPRFMPNGEFMGFIGVGIDIHEQKLAEFALQESGAVLEKLVRDRTSQLERSNEDLQQFAHVASHDLKEPVRKIKTFAYRLETELAGKGTAATSTYLAKILSAADRLSSMVEGVLNFSKVGAMVEAVETIDIAEIICEIEGDLEVVIAQKSAVFVKQNLPKIQGARFLIYQLFYNLINNSLKFSRVGVPSVIVISAAATAVYARPYVELTIADNGIGFDHQYEEKIFETFLRLNSKDKYEGTGLGLALCKKIVTRHGGTIIARGKKDHGAEFIITLPLGNH